MREILNLKYSGKKIQQNKGMAVSEVAESLEGFADFLKALTSSSEDDPTITIVVQGFRKGSLDIQLALEIAAAAQTTLAAVGVHDLTEAVKQAFKLLKHLKGETPKSIKQADHGSVIVENNSGQILVFNQPVVHAILNTDASQSAEQFIKRPLRAEAEKLEIKVNGKIAAKVDRSISENFIALGNGEALGEFNSQQHLTIQTVVLEGDGHWRFSDGRNKFRAQIEDEAFLERVRQGRERFGRGDILKVKLRSVQEKVRGQLRTSHFIEEVLGHEPYRQRQTSLF
jgi:hypothetical protein